MDEDEARTLGGDHIGKHVENEEEEDMHNAVSIHTLGFTMYFYLDSKESVLPLFEALKHVTEVEAD